MPNYKQFFNKDDKTKEVKFTGDRLDVYIPRRYENHDSLTVRDTILTLGIFDMVINNSIHVGYYLPAYIGMIPSEVDDVSYQGEPCVKATFYKDDIFIKNTNVVRNQGIVYIIFKEFVSLGKQPSFISYRDSAFMFDSAQKVCGVKFPVDHVIFEILFSHLYRDLDQVTIPYRNTDMTKIPVRIPLTAVAHATTSTTAKLVGSYFENGVNSALVNQSDESSDIENLLRS